jgi:hypothetical protein
MVECVAGGSGVDGVGGATARPHILTSEESAVGG